MRIHPVLWFLSLAAVGLLAGCYDLTLAPYTGDSGGGDAGTSSGNGGGASDAAGTGGATAMGTGGAGGIDAPVATGAGGTAGASGVGGTTSTGGTTASGGTASSGGMTGDAAGTGGGTAVGTGGAGGIDAPVATGAGGTGSGATGTGGTTGSGGTVSSGGMTASGGRIGTGGAVGTGGVVGTGGGTGGAVGTGGVVGTGGAAAAGDWAGWPMPNDQVDVTAGAPNLESYRDNGDGTVTDDLTGLMWQQTVPTGTYTWAQAVAYCPTLTLANHSDWRLPSRIELVSIVDFGVTSGATINATYFPSTPAAGFWSSSLLAGLSSSAWVVYFSDGDAGYLAIANTGDVRCVR